VTADDVIVLYNKEANTSDVLRMDLQGTKVQGVSLIHSIEGRVSYLASQGDALIYDSQIAFLG